MLGNVDDAILRPLIASDLIPLKATLKVVENKSFWSGVLDLAFSAGQQLGETTVSPAKRGPGSRAPAGTSRSSEGVRLLLRDEHRSPPAPFP